MTASSWTSSRSCGSCRPGAQVIAGFLLTLPFQGRFDSLDDLQRTVYLALVLVAGLTTALLLTPVAVHRRLSGAHVKERVVTAAHHVVALALTALALLISGIVFFTFDVVVSRLVACIAGGAVLAVLVALLLVVPIRLAHGPADRAAQDGSGG